MSSFKAPPQPAKQRTIPSADIHPARLYSIVDIGTHDSSYKGEVKKKRQIVLTWELPESLHQFSKEKGLEPLAISKPYNWAMGNIASLRLDIEAWRGGTMTEDEATEFDIVSMLGKPCQLTISHVEKNGTKYANIVSISKDHPKAPCPPAVNPKVSYHIDQGTGGMFSKLPEWLQKKIRVSKEFSDPQAPTDDRSHIDDTQADKYADELEKKQKEDDDLTM